MRRMRTVDGKKWAKMTFTRDSDSDKCKVERPL